MSSSGAHTRAATKREYRLGRRAEKQEATRRRIVEAAFDLHSTVGPARTTVSQIAERAGVQRLERDPLPRFDALKSVLPGRERVRRGLEDLYGWYSRNARQAACVLRDAEDHALTREMVQLRLAPVLEQAASVLGEALEQRSRALLGVALDFACWRTLARSVDAKEAAELMSDAVVKA